MDLLAALPSWGPYALALAALLAGLVDAIVGGGGLIQLPALLLVPGIQPAVALGTNKVGSIFGTVTSAITYARRVPPNFAKIWPAIVAAFVASFGGAVVASHLPASVFTPVIVIVLAGVLVFTLARPQFGIEVDEQTAPTATRAVVRAVCVGGLIGFYDGVLGPGTGSFLVIAFVAALHFEYLHAAGAAKWVNVATNAGALTFFVPLGVIDWRVALLLGAANMTGGYLGARLAVRLGSKFVRITLIVVVSALLLRLGWGLIAG
ncbi:TSUP family transporter [Pseudoclavibacter soli]|uniref:TSUP family transporter n=1 Tax=Pseudoclavibacter soli TaxID=452623 RepID=UPI0004260690